MVMLALVFLLLHLFKDSVCLQGNNICDGKIREKFVEICCSDYEEYDNKCVPCEVGFTSENGKSCMPCEGSTFGSRCGETCSCSQSERCDHVDGCVKIGASVTTEDIDLITFREQEYTDQTTVEEHVDQYTHQEPINQATESKHINQGRTLHLTVLLYTLGITVVVISILTGLIYFLFKNKHKQKKVLDSEINVSPDGQRNVYDEIDKTAFLESDCDDIQSNSGYLTVIDETNKAEAVNDEGVLQSKYENTNSTFRASNNKENGINLNGELESKYEY